jgi:hypothetical protein
MTADTATFEVALCTARDAVDQALDSLNTLEQPDSEYVLPLLKAQGALDIAVRRFEALRDA